MITYTYLHTKLLTQTTHVKIVDQSIFTLDLPSNAKVAIMES